MAKKKAARIDPQTAEVVSRLQDSIGHVQRDADALLRRTQQQAVELISRDQRRAIERLFRQAQRLRGDLERRAQRASKDVESRAERFLSTLEKETFKRVGPILKRLDVPSRDELRQLSQRLVQLERKLGVSSKSGDTGANGTTKKSTKRTARTAAKPRKRPPARGSD